MTVNRRDIAGRMVMMGLPSSSMDAFTLFLIREYRIGNFIIFSRNAKDGPAKLRQLIDDLKEACHDAGLPTPIIAVDQEGGSVQRLGAPWWEEIPSNETIGLSEEPLLSVARQAKAAASTMKSVGINFNFAPVLDLAPPGAEGVLKKRSYGEDPEKTAWLGGEYIKSLQEEGIGATAKHFPGIGRVIHDPHERMAVVEVPREILFGEMYPFKKAIDEGVLGIMTSHVLFTALDVDEIATFSSIIATDFLRQELGFDQLLFTDDMEMGGVTGHIRPEVGALKAVKAGHDMILICHKGELVKKAVETLEDGIGSGEIKKEQVLRSLDRQEMVKEVLAVG